MPEHKNNVSPLVRASSLQHTVLSLFVTDALVSVTSELDKIVVIFSKVSVEKDVEPKSVGCPPTRQSSV